MKNEIIDHFIEHQFFNILAMSTGTILTWGYLVINGCFNASYNVILNSGYFLSNFLMKSWASSLTIGGNNIL